MGKRLSPEEKDKSLRTWLNRMRINQVHKATVKLNEQLTWEEIEDSDAFVNDANELVYNGQRYAVLKYDFKNETYEVRKLGDQQDTGSAETS